jgi:hypothetical protein
MTTRQQYVEFEVNAVHAFARPVQTPFAQGLTCNRFAPSTSETAIEP